MPVFPREITPGDWLPSVRTVPLGVGPVGALGIAAPLDGAAGGAPKLMLVSPPLITPGDWLPEVDTFGLP
jgi:hypothetical protein